MQEVHPGFKGKVIKHVIWNLNSMAVWVLEYTSGKVYNLRP